MKTTFWVTEILLRIALQAKNGDTCPQGQFFFFKFWVISSWKWCYYHATILQPTESFCHNSPDHISGVQTDGDSFIPRRRLRTKMGLTFHSQSFPPELSSSQSCKCCQSLKMTSISPIWGRSARWKPACTSSRICVRPETVPPRRHTKLDWRRQEDNDRDAAETFFFFMQGSGRERKRPLERRGNAGGGRVSGETSKRAVSPPQMRLLCQVQGYYDAAEESSLKQGAQSRQDWRS